MSLLCPTATMKHKTSSNLCLLSTNDSSIETDKKKTRAVNIPQAPSLFSVLGRYRANPLLIYANRMFCLLARMHMSFSLIIIREAVSID